MDRDICRIVGIKLRERFRRCGDLFLRIALIVYWQGGEKMVVKGEGQGAAGDSDNANIGSGVGRIPGGENETKEKEATIPP